MIDLTWLLVLYAVVITVGLCVALNKIDDIVDERDFFRSRLERLAHIACPDGYAEGYEDAAILSALRRARTDAESEAAF